VLRRNSHGTALEVFLSSITSTPNFHHVYSLLVCSYYVIFCFKGLAAAAEVVEADESAAAQLLQGIVDLTDLPEPLAASPVEEAPVDMIDVLAASVVNLVKTGGTAVDDGDTVVDAADSATAVNGVEPISTAGEEHAYMEE
jgi:hypothetical protein